MKANRKMKTKKQKKTKIIYYTDELNDDFAGTNIKQKKVDSNFKTSAQLCEIPNRRKPLLRNIIHAMLTPIGEISESLPFRPSYPTSKLIKL